MRRWSSRPTITRSWRIGSIPLHSIPTSIKSLGSRVAAKIALLRAPNPNTIVRLQDLPPTGARVFDARLKQDIAAHLKTMLTEPSREAVDEDGIDSRCVSDVWRGSEIYDFGTFSKGIQIDLPSKRDDIRESTIHSRMKDFGRNNFQGSTALMEAFTKVSHQGAFAPMTGKLAALMRLCPYDTPPTQAHAVGGNQTTRSFTLLDSSISNREANLQLRMNLCSTEIAIGKGAQTPTQYGESSNLSCSARVHISIKLDQIDAAQQALETGGKSVETKHRADDSRPTRQTEDLTTYPSRLPSNAVTVEVLDGHLSYDLTRESS